MNLKKISQLILVTLLVGTTYAQTNDSITKNLTEELEQIVTAKPIVGFSVAIVNEEGTLYVGILVLLIMAPEVCPK